MPQDQEWKFKPYRRQTIRQPAQRGRLLRELQKAVEVVSRLLPFRVNAQVLNEWDRVPDDPAYRLTFSHRDMLEENEYSPLRNLQAARAPEGRIEQCAGALRYRMNPHPAAQMTHTAAQLDAMALPGVQHKYRAALLFFPSAGQTGHVCCTFCFSWPPFVAMEEDGLKFQAQHSEVTDLLITGGDSPVMNPRSLDQHLGPLLNTELEPIRNRPSASKAVACWPQRFVTDKDSDDLLRIVARVVRSGKSRGF